MKPIDAVDGKQLHSSEASFELAQPLFPRTAAFKPTPLAST
jgi:hypothetical protein